MLVSLTALPAVTPPHNLKPFSSQVAEDWGSNNKANPFFPTAFLLFFSKYLSGWVLAQSLFPTFYLRCYNSCFKTSDPYSKDWNCHPVAVLHTCASFAKINEGSEARSKDFFFFCLLILDHVPQEWELLFLLSSKCVALCVFNCDHEGSKYFLVGDVFSSRLGSDVLRSARDSLLPQRLRNIVTTLWIASSGEEVLLLTGRAPVLWGSPSAPDNVMQEVSELIDCVPVSNMLFWGLSKNNVPAFQISF